MNRLITYFIFAVRIQHALSWALPHPPSIPQAQQQKPMFGAAYSPGSEDDDDYSDVDIVDRRQFQGSHTYANLPHVDCLSGAEAEKGQRYDIAILGAPFDTASQTQRLRWKICTPTYKDMG